MFSELVARNSRRSRRENGLFFTSLLISIVAFYIILSLSHQDVMVFLQRMESSAVDRLLSLVPVLYGLTLFILFFLVYYANRFQLARRRHEFGVYLMLGMQRRKLFPRNATARSHAWVVGNPVTTRPESGAEFRIGVDPTKIHLFDAASERVIN